MLQVGLQPPSGGCVLKPLRYERRSYVYLQPPSGGCVLKQYKIVGNTGFKMQPPSGGCVLKRSSSGRVNCPVSSRLRAAVC